MHYPVSSNGVVDIDISFFGLTLHFPYNKIVKIEGDGNNYKIISNEQLMDHGSIIELHHNPEGIQGSIISFFDNNGKVTDINLTSSFLGATSITIRKRRFTPQK